MFCDSFPDTQIPGTCTVNVLPETIGFVSSWRCHHSGPLWIDVKCTIMPQQIMCLHIQGNFKDSS